MMMPLYCTDACGGQRAFILFTRIFKYKRMALMADVLRFSRVVFKRFKAFKSFTLNLRRINILVGPNNSGKSTILAAFRILAAGLRKANARSAQLVDGPDGRALGYTIDLDSLSVGEENIFFNYDESEPASITFSLAGGSSLVLYFPEPGSCSMIANNSGRMVTSPSAFRSSFNCPIGFVPILGPVEHDEKTVRKRGRPPSFVQL